MTNDFTFIITADQLSKGLRPSRRMPRDSKYLIESKGAVGREGVLVAIDELARMATTEITDGFPYPQIFVFTNVMIVCGSTKIYERVGTTLVLKLTVAANLVWSAVDFYDYIYMSNGKVAVVRDSGTGGYTVTTDLPAANSMLNYNGQVIIGTPVQG